MNTGTRPSAMRGMLALMLLVPASGLYAQVLISNDGGTTVLPNTTISWSVGEPIIGTATTPNGVMMQGYQQPTGRRIRCAVVGATFCANGSPAVVNYTTPGSFAPGNTFTAQLSDALGSFASPVNIGSVSAQVSGTINAIIPVVPGGTGYRIRVVSSAPFIVGSDNGVDLTLFGANTYYADADGDGLGDPAMDSLACTQPAGYVVGATDACPLVPGSVGSPCDDGSIYTSNDVLQANCTCAGTVSCADAMQLTLNTDANAAQTSWMVVLTGTNTPVCSGSLNAANSNGTITATCCVPNGCYDLIVLDQFGDGINPGGFVLRDQAGNRIIDNAGNGFAFTYGSQVSNWGFCIPLGTQALTAATCDQQGLAFTSVVQAQPNAAVTSAYSSINSNTGYQFWVYNPNGGFSRRIFFSHAAPGTGWPGTAPVGERCSYFRLNAMATSAPAIPGDVLLNVRVRQRVNGVYAEFGPACRLRIDPLNNCQTTQLTFTADPVVSCGATGLTTSSTVWATPVAGATHYQFEFSRPGYLRRIVATTRSQRLSWVTLPLEYNRCYNVRVRASLDNIQTYCPFGPTCTITLGAAACGGAMAQQNESDGLLEETGRVSIWPNPNNSDRLFVRLTDLPQDVDLVSVDIFDLFGKRVLSSTLPIQDGLLLDNVIALNNELAAGPYLVHFTVGEHTSTQRLIIQR